MDGEKVIHTKISHFNAWCRVHWTVAMQGKEASVPNVLAETEEVTSSLAASSYSLLSQREPGQQVAWCRMCLHTSYRIILYLANHSTSILKLELCQCVNTLTLSTIYGCMSTKNLLPCF